MPRLLRLVVKVQQLPQARQTHLLLQVFIPVPMRSRPVSMRIRLTAAVTSMSKAIGILSLPPQLAVDLRKRAIRHVLPEGFVAITSTMRERRR